MGVARTIETAALSDEAAQWDAGGALVQQLGSELQRSLVCPVCMELMRDAFLTRCGHSFCYQCLTHVFRQKHACPTCSSYITEDSIFPNFLLSKASGGPGGRRIAL